jgi:hypothetical protein
MQARLRNMGKLAFALAMTGAGCSSEPSGAERTARLGAAVEGDYRWAHFEYLFQPDEASVSTAALEVPVRGPDGAPIEVNGVPVRYTCGLTFVSAHYAITAAHCVPKESILDPARDMFPVSTYDISAVPWDTLVAAQRLRGWFPNYDHTTLTAADGYKQSTLSQCHVIQRCGAAWGAYACGMEADVALIKCDDRSPFGAYMDVAQSDDGRGAVDMHWYHEVYAVTTQRPTPPADPNDPLAQAIYEALLDKWDHYVNHAFGSEENYHYLASNQLMPLVSSPWYEGDLVMPRTRVGSEGTMTWTDLFGCHGSSGSGITQIGASGRHELLGPALKNGEGWDARLCENPSSAMRGHKLLSYTQLPYVRALYQTALDDPNEYWMWGKPQ